MARYSTNLREVTGSGGYIIEVVLEQDEHHPLLELGLEEVGQEMGSDQLYVRTSDVAGTRELISRIEDDVEIHRHPFLLLLSEDPATADSAGVVYLDQINSQEEAKEEIRELVDKLYDPKFMEENPTWKQRMKSVAPLLPSTAAVGADALTYIEHLPF